jgi:prepilin-type N-terminal cleavage/methylation domain-containing protein
MNKRLKRAFSLIEVIIAIGIFAVGILAILGNLPWVVESEKLTEMYTQASILAERYIELIKYDPDYQNLETNYNDTYSTRRSIAGFQAYKACLKVEAISGTSSDLKKITVIIFWYAHNREHSFTLVNLRKRG